MLDTYLLSQLFKKKKDRAKCVCKINYWSSVGFTCTLMTFLGSL